MSERWKNNSDGTAEIVLDGIARERLEKVRRKTIEEDDGEALTPEERKVRQQKLLEERNDIAQQRKKKTEALNKKEVAEEKAQWKSKIAEMKKTLEEREEGVKEFDRQLKELNKNMQKAQCALRAEEGTGEKNDIPEK